MCMTTQHHISASGTWGSSLGGNFVYISILPINALCPLSISLSYHLCVLPPLTIHSHTISASHWAAFHHIWTPNLSSLPDLPFTFQLFTLPDGHRPVTSWFIAMPAASSINRYQTCVKGMWKIHPLSCNWCYTNLTVFPLTYCACEEGSLFFCFRKGNNKSSVISRRICQSESHWIQSNGRIIPSPNRHL